MLLLGILLGGVASTTVARAQPTGPGTFSKAVYEGHISFEHDKNSPDPELYYALRCHEPSSESAPMELGEDGKCSTNVRQVMRLRSCNQNEWPELLVVTTPEGVKKNCSLWPDNGVAQDDAAWAKLFASHGLPEPNGTTKISTKFVVNPNGTNCTPLRKEYCTSMAYSWGSHMCSYEPQQFVRPYCDGETVKVGLYGADSTCSSQNELVAPIEPDLDLCYERDWWSKIYGPWLSFNNNRDPWEIAHKYKLECSPGGAVRIRHYWNCPNLKLNLTYEWPEGLCMDASDAACEDWDPARWVTADLTDGEVNEDLKALGSPTPTPLPMVLGSVVAAVVLLIALIVLAKKRGVWPFSGKGSTSNVPFTNSLKSNNLRVTATDLYMSLAADGQSETTYFTGSGSADTGEAVMPNIEEAILDLQQSMKHFSSLQLNNNSLEPALVELKSTNQPSIPSFTDYAPVRYVGGGTYGNTTLVQNRHSGQYYAMKAQRTGKSCQSGCLEMDLSAFAVAGAGGAEQVPKRSGKGDAAAELVKEAFFLRMLSGHPFICQHHETLIHDKKLLLVTEYCEGGDLESFLNRHGPMAEEELLHVLFSMAVAIRHCHRRNVAHRDIKPANIFCSSLFGAVVYKLGDFGASKLMLDPSATLVGTPVYMSPEMLLGEPYHRDADIYALGCTLITLGTGVLPFNTPSITELKTLKVQAEVPTLPSDSFSPFLVELTRAMMSNNPAERPSADDVCCLPECKMWAHSRYSQAVALSNAQAVPEANSSARDAAEHRVAMGDTANSVYETTSISTATTTSIASAR